MFRPKDTPAALKKVLQNGVGRLDREKIPRSNPHLVCGLERGYMNSDDSPAKVLGLVHREATI